MSETQKCKSCGCTMPGPMTRAVAICDGCLIDAKSDAASEGGTGTRPEKCDRCGNVREIRGRKTWNKAMSPFGWYWVKDVNACLVECDATFHFISPVASVEGQRTGEPHKIEGRGELSAIGAENGRQASSGAGLKAPPLRNERPSITSSVPGVEGTQCACCSAMLTELVEFTKCPENEDVVEHIKKLLSPVEGMGAREPTVEQSIRFIKKLESLGHVSTKLIYLRNWIEKYFSLRGAGGEGELERAREARKHTQDWYARHYGKVEDWARKILPEPWRTQFFNCVGNGIYDHTKDVGEPYMSVGAGMITPSGYFRMESAAEQLMRDQTERAEASESREQELADEIKQLRAWKESMMAVTPDGRTMAGWMAGECLISTEAESLLSSITEKGSTESREQAMRECLRVAIEWEADYRTRNNLGTRVPDWAQWAEKLLVAP